MQFVCRAAVTVTTCPTNGGHCEDTDENQTPGRYPHSQRLSDLLLIPLILSSRGPQGFSLVRTTDTLALCTGARPGEHPDAAHLSAGAVALSLCPVGDIYSWEAMYASQQHDEVHVSFMVLYRTTQPLFRSP